MVLFECLLYGVVVMSSVVLVQAVCSDDAFVGFVLWFAKLWSLLDSLGRCPLCCRVTCLRVVAFVVGALFAVIGVVDVSTD